MKWEFQKEIVMQKVFVLFFWEVLFLQKKKRVEPLFQKQFDYRFIICKILWTSCSKWKSFPCIHHTWSERRHRELEVETEMVKSIFYLDTAE